MTEPDGIEVGIQRRMLAVAVRNSARSVPLLVAAVVFIAWLGWGVGDLRAAIVTLVLGLGVALWRWLLGRAYPHELIAPERSRSVSLQLEGNAVVVGLMWVVDTVYVYPMLRDTTATVYVVSVCGSVASARLATINRFSVSSSKRRRSVMPPWLSAPSAQMPPSRT